MSNTEILIWIDLELKNACRDLMAAQVDKDDTRWCVAFRKAEVLHEIKMRLEGGNG